MTEQIKSTGEFTTSAMTANIAKRFIELAERKGRLAYSVSRQMREAADKMQQGSFQYGTGEFESFLSRSDIHELAEMDGQYNLLNGLLMDAVFGDEVLDRDDHLAYAQAVMAEAEAKYSEYAGA